MKNNPVLESDKIDFIGDVHGRYDLLEKFLEYLHYEKKEINGDIIYIHPEDRKIIFIGDYVDRGTQSKECMDLIGRLIKYGITEALMGNHEFNYIAYLTKRLKSKEYLRKHYDRNNNQIELTLKSVSGDEFKYISWMEDLLMYIRHPNFSAVHAHWNDEYISHLEESGDTLSKLGNYFNVQANTKGTLEFEIIDDILKGPERRLPDGQFLLDSDGNKRYDKRIEWWNEEKHDIPVFFGHYSIDSEPYLLSDKICCLDFGKFGKGKYLTAYRWDGETSLDSKKLFWLNDNDV